ncbi:hypothetical protein B0H94_11161 [Salsuginibacillus halophilus]|uniref:Uncharacterized protein n=1 Tax=Salsuginibacillus halophilus TaxID=517424 RepID=A0A2P8HAJ2_9BACI|nr:hypothetical protein [Salsuginibacillus halophilus]PSL43237.1 hypothetical protein B0H94_11161 [Salsuginibacillus halophilus]
MEVILSTLILFALLLISYNLNKLRKELKYKHSDQCEKSSLDEETREHIQREIKAALNER